MAATNKDAKDYTHLRKKLLVDRKVQGALVRQAALHWIWTTLTFGMVIFFSRIGPAWLTGAEGPTVGWWYHLSPYVIASVALIPIIVFATIRFSNRFAGPMVRVRRALKKLANGEQPERLKFREGDFWSDLADDINRIAERGQEAHLVSPAQESDAEAEAFPCRSVVPPIDQAGIQAASPSGTVG